MAAAIIYIPGEYRPPIGRDLNSLVTIFTPEKMKEMQDEIVGSLSMWQKITLGPYLLEEGKKLAAEVEDFRAFNDRIVRAKASFLATNPVAGSNDVQIFEATIAREDALVGGLQSELDGIAVTVSTKGTAEDLFERVIPEIVDELTEIVAAYEDLIGWSGGSAPEDLPPPTPTWPGVEPSPDQGAMPTPGRLGRGIDTSVELESVGGDTLLGYARGLMSGHIEGMEKARGKVFGARIFRRRQLQRWINHVTTKQSEFIKSGEGIARARQEIEWQGMGRSVWRDRYHELSREEHANVGDLEDIVLEIVNSFTSLSEDAMQARLRNLDEISVHMREVQFELEALASGVGGFTEEWRDMLNEEEVRDLEKVLALGFNADDLANNLHHVNYDVDVAVRLINAREVKILYLYPDRKETFTGPAQAFLRAVASGGFVKWFEGGGGGSTPPPFDWGGPSTDPDILDGVTKPGPGVEPGGGYRQGPAAYVSPGGRDLVEAEWEQPDFNSAWAAGLDAYQRGYIMEIQAQTGLRPWDFSHGLKDSDSGKNVDVYLADDEVSVKIMSTDGTMSRTARLDNFLINVRDGQFVKREASGPTTTAN
ncbi:hypothetical protein ACFL2M_01535 [Patescibacteria group bacterium]